MSRWFLTDCEPADRQVALVTVDDGISLGQYVNGNWYEVNTSGAYPRFEKAVIAWMYPPEPYGEDEDKDESEAADDPVNHPSHYEVGKYECLDVLRSIYGDNAVKDFCLCNVFKYLWRHKRKNGLEDLKKARWYLDKLIEMEEVHESMECHCNGDQNKACDGHCSDMGERQGAAGSLV